MITLSLEQNVATQQKWKLLNLALAAESRDLGSTVACIDG
jgi:hypothetical protein